MSTTKGTPLPCILGLNVILTDLPVTSRPLLPAGRGLNRALCRPWPWGERAVPGSVLLLFSFFFFFFFFFIFPFWLLAANVCVWHLTRRIAFPRVRYASRGGQLKVLQLLLDRNADPTITDRIGSTAAILAATEGAGTCESARARKREREGSRGGDGEVGGGLYLSREGGTNTEATDTAHCFWVYAVVLTKHIHAHTPHTSHLFRTATPSFIRRRQATTTSSGSCWTVGSIPTTSTRTVPVPCSAPRSGATVTSRGCCSREGRMPITSISMAPQR